MIFMACTFLFATSCEEKRVLPENPSGTVTFNRYSTNGSFFSEALNKNITYSMLFPADYLENKEERYPVVYMLHGYGESGRDWTKWVNVIKQLESNGLQPMIYIFPNCGNSYYCNSYDGKNMYMDMFVNELVPTVDKSYRTISDREHRAVMGYSMGGFGAMVLPLRNPDVFSISVPLSMSFRTDEQYMTESQDGWNSQWGSIFGGRGSSGSARLTDYYILHCPFYQFTKANLEKLSKIKWFFHCGDDEEQLLIANDNLHVQLRENGYSHEFRIGDGGHDGDYWRNAARETLPWIAHCMNSGGDWTTMAGSKPSVKEVIFNEDGSFTSKALANSEETDALAIYVAYEGYSAELLKKIMSFFTKSSDNRKYMVLPCDLTVKTLSEWKEFYAGLYEVGKSVATSHVVAFEGAGKEVYAHRDLFNAYAYYNADIVNDGEEIIVDADKTYYIDQTDDGPNYDDMNALYRACKKVVREDGKVVEAEFEYRMRNSHEDKEQELIYAAKSIGDNLEYR